MMKFLKSGSVFFVAVFILVLCSGWGFLVHRTVNQIAVYQLPKSIRPFFHQNMDYLVKNSVRADQRRNKDSSEAPKHFIDAEAYGDSALWKMPYSWSRAVVKYTKDSLEKYGYVPYWVIVMKERLTDAFRKGDKDSILFYAADIAHYIGDAHVPLHTTLNYDGQLTNQKGLHSLWESMIPEIELQDYNLYSSHDAKYLKDPEVAIWTTVRRSFTLLNEVFKEEIEASKQFTDSTKYRVQNRNGREVKNYTTAFAREYSKRLGETINKQLLLSSNLCADFWYTCWVDAGKPDLKKLMREAEDDGLEKELKAYKKNKLLTEKLLIAKQNENNSD